MNNRKQSNKRGVNPRQYKVQLAPEPQFIKFTNPSGEKELMENSEFGKMRRIYHKN